MDHIGSEPQEGEEQMDPPSGQPTGGRQLSPRSRTAWMRMPSRVSSSGWARSRSQRIAWTSYPARAKVLASFAIRGSTPAGLFDRTKTTRTAMSSQERRDLLRDLFPGRPVAERVRPLPFCRELAPDGGADLCGVGPREHIRSDLEGLRALRVLAKRDAGHVEDRK